LLKPITKYKAYPELSWTCLLPTYQL